MSQGELLHDIENTVKFGIAAFQMFQTGRGLKEQTFNFNGSTLASGSWGCLDDLAVFNVYFRTLFPVTDAIDGKASPLKPMV